MATPPISTSTLHINPPFLSGLSPFLAKILEPSSDSIFGRSYSSPSTNWVFFSTQLTVGGRGRAHVHNSVMSLIRMNQLEKYTDIYASKYTSKWAINKNIFNFNIFAYNFTYICTIDHRVSWTITISNIMNQDKFMWNKVGKLVKNIWMKKWLVFFSKPFPM